MEHRRKGNCWRVVEQEVRIRALVFSFFVRSVHYPTLTDALQPGSCHYSGKTSIQSTHCQCSCEGGVRWIHLGTFFFPARPLAFHTSTESKLAPR